MAITNFERAEKHNDKVDNTPTGLMSAIDDAWSAKQGSFQKTDTTNDNLPEMTLCSSNPQMDKWIRKTYGPIGGPIAQTAVNTAEASDRAGKAVGDKIQHIQDQVKQGLDVFTFPFRKITGALETK